MTVARFDLLHAPLDRGTLLIEASAGTGKTYTLVGLVLRLLLEGAIEKLERALVVTFTVAATEELKERLRAGLERVLRVAAGEPCDDELYRHLAQQPAAAQRVRQALDDFDRAPIATIHGFCKRLLDESAFETRQPFRLDFVVDPLPLLHRAAADVLRRTYAEQPTPRHAVLALTGLTPDTLATAYRLWQRHPDVALVPERPDLERCLAALEAPLATAATTFDAAIQQQIAALCWKQDESPFGADVDGDLKRLAATLREQPLLALGALVELAPKRLTDVLLKASPRPGAQPFFVACDAIAVAVDDAVAHLRATLLLDLHAALAHDKQRQHVLTYDDLLQRTHAALQDPDRREVLLAAIRARYDTALIDEFQDTDAMQYAIFEACFARRPLFLVGDPKQSIYGFRGADLGTYRRAREAADVETLGTNHRSSAPLVAAVAHVFAAPNAFVEPGITLPAVQAEASPGTLGLDGDAGAALRWRLVSGGADDAPLLPIGKEDAEQRIAADVAAEIARLLAAGVTRDGARLRPRDCAVLTRTNKQALRVQAELRAAGIVSAIGKAGDIFDSAELVEVERLLRAVLQPRDLRLARAAMATRLWGRDAAWLRASHEANVEFDQALLQLDEWRRLWHRRGLVVMAERLLADLAVVPRLLAQRGGERALTNCQQIVELLHQAEHAERLSPEGLLEWLQHERRHKEELDYQLRELRLESDEDAVQILTVHGSKGLQYEVVFCPFLWDGRRPRAPELVPAPDRRTLAFTLDANQKGAIEAARLAEDVRLCYVALTRARRRCYVHAGNILVSNLTGMWRSALGWLLWPAPPGSDLAAPQQFDAWAKDLKARLPKLAERLAALCQAAGGAIDVTRVPAVPVAPPVPPPMALPLGPARTARREPHWRALHSFTSLVAGAPGADPAPDVADPAAAPTIATAVPDAGTGIFAFARGARAGQCLHTLLEHADLDALDDAATATLVRDTLVAFGFVEPAAHAGPIEPVAAVLQNLRDLAAARVHDGGPTIAALCRGDSAAEWKFTLPVPGSRTEPLASAFAQHGSALARRYADRLRTLPARHLRGFLVGFVDLVAVHGERHWIVDWKSNHLGHTAADYGADALAEVMVASDYVLQYHLYVLALHRQLRARLRDYDYDRHHGGVCYAFLRGAVPDSGNGMLFDRVPKPLVEAMDRWLRGER